MGQGHGGRLVDRQLGGGELRRSGHRQHRGEAQGVDAVAGTEEPRGQDGRDHAAARAQDADEGELRPAREHEHRQGLGLPRPEGGLLEI